MGLPVVPLRFTTGYFLPRLRRLGVLQRDHPCVLKKTTVHGSKHILVIVVPSEYFYRLVHIAIKSLPIKNLRLRQ
jgi:hypothetical protein